MNRFLFPLLAMCVGTFFQNVSLASEPLAASSLPLSRLAMRALKETDIPQVTEYRKGVIHGGVFGSIKEDGSLDEDSVKRYCDNQITRLKSGNPYALSLVFEKSGEDAEEGEGTLVALLQLGVQPVKEYSTKYKPLVEAFTALIGIEYEEKDGKYVFIPESYRTGIATCSIAIQPSYSHLASSVIGLGFDYCEQQALVGKILPQGNPIPTIVSAIIDPVLGEAYRKTGFKVLVGEKWHLFYDLPRYFAVKEIRVVSDYIIDWRTLDHQLSAPTALK